MELYLHSTNTPSRYGTSAQGRLPSDCKISHAEFTAIDMLDELWLKRFNIEWSFSSHNSKAGTS